jgi:hypothetical protein
MVENMHNKCKCNSLDNSTKQSKKRKKKIAKSLHEIREPFVGKAFFLRHYVLEIESGAKVQCVMPNNGAFLDITSKEKIISMAEKNSNKWFSLHLNKTPLLQGNYMKHYMKPLMPTWNKILCLKNLQNDIVIFN